MFEFLSHRNNKVHEVEAGSIHLKDLSDEAEARRKEKSIYRAVDLLVKDAARKIIYSTGLNPYTSEFYDVVQLTRSQIKLRWTERPLADYTFCIVKKNAHIKLIPEAHVSEYVVSTVDVILNHPENENVFLAMAVWRKAKERLEAVEPPEEGVESVMKKGSKQTF